MFALVTNSRDSRERPQEHDDVLHFRERLVGERISDTARPGTRRSSAPPVPALQPVGGPLDRMERKRGKLQDLNQLLRGVRDRFPVKVGNIEAPEACST